MIGAGVRGKTSRRGVTICNVWVAHPGRSPGRLAWAARPGAVMFCDGLSPVVSLLAREVAHSARALSVRYA